MNCMALREPYVPPLEPGCAYTPKLELVVVPYWQVPKSFHHWLRRNYVDNNYTIVLKPVILFCALTRECSLRLIIALHASSAI